MKHLPLIARKMFARQARRVDREVIMQYLMAGQIPLRAADAVPRRTILYATFDKHGAVHAME